MESIAARVVLVESSEEDRARIAAQLRQAGFEVHAVSDAALAAETTLTTQPAVVITDVWLAGMSGLQLCRVLRAEPSTAHVPVILMGAANDRRGRFLAQHAGAVGFVVKERGDDLVKLLTELTAGAATPAPRVPRPPGSKNRLEDRLAELLDDALSDSVLSSEVRALGNAGSFDGLFTGLAQLVAQLSGYRWLALADSSGHLGIHAHPSARRSAETEARAAVRAGGAARVFFVDESRPVDGVALIAPLVETISFGGVHLGVLAMAPDGRSPGARPGAPSDDARLFSLIALELGGPMRMTALMEDARRLAAIDGLTQLMNRRAFSDALGREISSATRHMHPLSVVVLDIDHFKAINDTRGHAGGDAVLRALGRLLATETRRSDLCGRWGGEEFVMALTHTDRIGARVVADRLRARIGELDITIGDSRIPITASLGVATLAQGESLDELVARADRAMYGAKSRGRNRVEAA
jgi:diguanylate cyclase (GGDEF)-like protein